MKHFIAANSNCFAIVHDKETMQAWIEPVAAWMIDHKEENACGGEVIIDRACCEPIRLNVEYDETSRDVIGIFYQDHKFYHEFSGFSCPAKKILDAIMVASRQNGIKFDERLIDYLRNYG